MLETNSKTTSFHMYIVYQRNKLFMRKYLFFMWSTKEVILHICTLMIAWR